MSCETRKRLEDETRKWLDRIGKVGMEGDKWMTENIRAYVSDAEYFLGKGDLVRAFEAVIWAWAWYEIGREIGRIRDRNEG